MASEPEPLLLVHIEDDPLWREIVAKLLTDNPVVRAVHSAGTAAAGLELCRGLAPDVALLDLRLPDADGFELLDLLTRTCPALRILFLTVRVDDVTLHRLEQNHVAGMVWKSKPLPLGHQSSRVRPLPASPVNNRVGEPL